MVLQTAGALVVPSYLWKILALQIILQEIKTILPICENCIEQYVGKGSS